MTQITPGTDQELQGKRQGSNIFEITAGAEAIIFFAAELEKRFGQNKEITADDIIDSLDDMGIGWKEIIYSTGISDTEKIQLLKLDSKGRLK